jgi:hypothetical protein
MSLDILHCPKVAALVREFPFQSYRIFSTAHFLANKFDGMEGSG